MSGHVAQWLGAWGEGSFDLSHWWVCSFSTARVQLGILFDTTSWLASCACAMTDTAEGRTSGAEQSPIEVAPAASSAPTSPVPAPSEPSSADGVFVNFHGREE